MHLFFSNAPITVVCIHLTPPVGTHFAELNKQRHLAEVHIDALLIAQARLASLFGSVRNVGRHQIWESFKKEHNSSEGRQNAPLRLRSNM